MEREDVCYTRGAALKKAIELEQESVDAYRKAYLFAKDSRVKDLVKELALEELEHKYTLEKAFFEEAVSLHEAEGNMGPSMKFSLLLKKKPLSEDSTPQDVLIHAIHDKKRAVDFYEKLAEHCAGAPMEGMYKKLQKDETGHLTRLEELYESIYMAEM